MKLFSVLLLLMCSSCGLIRGIRQTDAPRTEHWIGNPYLAPTNAPAPVAPISSP